MDVEHQEVIWVPEERNVPLVIEQGTARTLRIWTLIQFSDPNVVPPLPIVPAHNVNAFLEDYVHDWNHSKNVLRYYSRVVHSQVWILVEFLKERPRRSSKK